MTASHDATLRLFEDGLAELGGADYELTLYVSGASDLAARAIANARRLCETHLAGRYQLSVVDVHDDAAALLAARVLATPTLVKSLPLPVRRIVGDLSQSEKVLRALDVAAPADPTSPEAAT